MAADQTKRMLLPDIELAVIAMRISAGGMGWEDVQSLNSVSGWVVSYPFTDESSGRFIRHVGFHLKSVQLAFVWDLSQGLEGSRFEG